MDKICFAFDIDETLTISGGSIKPAVIKVLHGLGHITGLCGNWSHYVASIPSWHEHLSFVGQFYGYTSKEVFLQQLKDAMMRTGNVGRFIMIGNDPAYFGNSNDIEAARLAGWEFIREDQFRLEDFL
jgi:hypothetical protein